MRKFAFLVLLGLTAIATALGATGLFYQSPAPWRWVFMAGTLVVATLIVRVARTRPVAGWAVLAVALLAGALWWGSILPSNDRVWESDVERGVTADIESRAVVLHNVRDFDWRSETDFTPRWITHRYNLDQLTSVDLVSSVWASPAIAHTLISFGFEGGARVVFSAEVRREKGEAFSEVGGFFKQFELVMIAATERDIVRLRTNIRGESVTLLPLKVSKAQAEGLFRRFAARANQLAARPEFYQTVTTNCTTVIFELARQVDSRVPLDWRILLSGYLPGYLYDLGIIRNDLPLEQVLRDAAISDRARRLPPSADFSQGIRAAP